MYELKHVSIGSLTRVLAVLFALLYVLLSIFSILVAGGGGIGFGGSVVAGIAGLVLFAGMGAITGALVSWIYNFTAKRWGGIHLDFLLVHDDDEHETHQDARAGTVSVEKNQ